MNNFLINFNKKGLIFGLEEFIKDFYLVISQHKSLFYFLISLITLVLAFSYEFLTPEIHSILCNILFGCLLFITLLEITYYFVTHDKSVEFKNNNNLLYNGFIIFSVVLLLGLVFFCLYNIDKLILSIIYIITNSIKDFIKGYIIKMMGSSQPPLAPGGFGQPVGGGGKPPKKPGGSGPAKGHYVEKDKKRKRLSELTEEEFIEHRKNQREARNTKRRFQYLREETRQKQNERAIAGQRDYSDSSVVAKEIDL